MEETDKPHVNSMILLYYDKMEPTHSIVSGPEIKVKNELHLPHKVKTSRNGNYYNHRTHGSLLMKIETAEEFFNRINKTISEYNMKIRRARMILQRTLQESPPSDQGRGLTFELFPEKYLNDYIDECNESGDAAALEKMKKDFLNFSSTYNFFNKNGLDSATEHSTINASLSPSSIILIRDNYSPWYARRSEFYTSTALFRIQPFRDESSKHLSELYNLRIRIDLKKSR